MDSNANKYKLFTQDSGCLPANEKPLLTLFLLLDNQPFYQASKQINDFFVFDEWVCVIVAGVCLFSGKTEKPISDMFAVCGAGGRSQCWKCGWCVLFSLHANYAGITTCGLFAQC